MIYYGNLSHINKCYYLKQHIPMCHRNFLLKISQNREYIQTFFAIIEAILFNLLVVNVICIIIHKLCYSVFI